MAKTIHNSALVALSKNLRTIMEAKGYTQQDVAKYAKQCGGISQKTVSNMLNRTRGVNLDKLDVLAALFGLPASELIAEDFEIVSLIPLKTKGSRDSSSLPPEILRAAKKLAKLPPEQQNSILSLIESFSVL